MARVLDDGIAQAQPSFTVALRTRGRQAGPVVRLVSPAELGERLKPFVFLDLADIAPGPAGAMRWHPHSGIATLTLILTGSAEYRETTGVHGTLGPGGVEWMAAGRGVWHTAAPVGDDRLRGFQLWIALPPDRELDTPPSMYLDAAKIPVILGNLGSAKSPIPAPPGVTFLDVRLEAGEAWTFEPPAGHDALWVAVYKGRTGLAGEHVEAGELVVLEGKGEFAIHADAKAGFVLGSAPRSPAPLHLGDHSVHGSAAALRAGQAEIARLGGELRAAGMST